jgi:hypothetical protein
MSRTFTQRVARRPRRTSCRAGITARLKLEHLEDRSVPSTVSNLADSGPGSLRQAILDSNSTPGNNLITFAPGVSGTINLASALPDLSGNIDLEGPGADVLTVQRSTAVGTIAFRVFTVDNGATVTLAGLTVANGQAGDLGGGIYNVGTLTVTDCTIAGNVGGGIYNVGTLTVTDCTIANNVIGYYSAEGGIFSSSWENLTVTDCTIAGNGGGGIVIGENLTVPAHLTVTDCTIVNNSSGINITSSAVAQGGVVTVTDCTIANNRATLGGGMNIDIASSAVVVTVTDCTIANNTALSGGGIILNAGTLVVTASTIAGNVARGSGGGIRLDTGTLLVTASTIAGNVATGNGGTDFDGKPRAGGGTGGGILLNAGTATIINSIHHRGPRPGPKCLLPRQRRGNLEQGGADHRQQHHRLQRQPGRQRRRGPGPVQ